MATKTINYANAFLKDMNGNVGHIRGLSEKDVTTLKNGIANAVVTTDVNQTALGVKTFTNLKVTNTFEAKDANDVTVPEPYSKSPEVVAYRSTQQDYSENTPATMKWVRRFLSARWDPTFNGSLGGTTSNDYVYPYQHGFSYRGAQLIGDNRIYKDFDTYREQWSVLTKGYEKCLGDYFSVTVGSKTYYFVIAEIVRLNTNPTNNWHEIKFLVTDGVPTAMNSSDNTQGGYVGSTMHTSTAVTYYNELGANDDAPFRTSDHNLIQTDPISLSSGIDTTKTNMCDSAYKGVTSTIDKTTANLVIPSEYDFLGCNMLSGSRLDSISSRQLNIFRYASLLEVVNLFKAAGCTLDFTKYKLWTRSIASSTDYVALDVSTYGVESEATNASELHCPLFLMTMIESA